MCERGRGRERREAAKHCQFGDSKRDTHLRVTAVGLGLSAVACAQLFGEHPPVIPRPRQRPFIFIHLVAIIIDKREIKSSKKRGAVDPCLYISILI